MRRLFIMLAIIGVAFSVQAQAQEMNRKEEKAARKAEREAQKAEEEFRKNKAGRNSKKKYDWEEDFLKNV